MKSLTIKLILAFLVISLTVAALGAFFAWRVTTYEFQTFVVDRIQDEFIAMVSSYYQEHGSWLGILKKYPPRPPLQTQSQDPDNQKQAPISFTLVDQTGIVLLPSGSYRPHDRVPANVLSEGTPIEIEGQIVGTALITGQVPELNQVEQRYLKRTNQALLLAALSATGIALILGILLARSLTRPLRELTTATRAVARGDLEQRVAVRSQDELGELTAAFNQMSTDLARATQSRRQMTADIAHDLRTPLTVIGGYLESMRDGVLKPTPDRLEMMQAEVGHLKRLVDDLRTLSLADAGSLTLDKHEISPQTLLLRVTDIYQLIAEKIEVSLTARIAPALPVVTVDEERLVQVLGNLVSNALRYTPKGGQIILEAKRGVDSVLLSVQDTGIGITAEDLSRIFDRFYRADQSRRQNEGESGLGLSIARSIIEAHGGTIEVESEMGCGTKFTITLPVST